MKTIITTTKHFAVLSAALLFALMANLAYGQWSDPVAEPTNGNVEVPINIGASEQAKAGNLKATEFHSNLYCDADGENCVPAGGGSTDPVDGNVYNYLDTLWTKVGDIISTDKNVQIDQSLSVTGVVTANSPAVTQENGLVTIEFLKSLFSDLYGYRDFGNMRDAQNVPQVAYTDMREFYSPDQETADFLCQYMGYDEGTWTGTGGTSLSGWNYHNLAIVTYKPGKGFTNSYARSGQRFMCFGTACRYSSARYISNLRCLSQVENELQTAMYTQQYLTASQISNFPVQITTEYRATSDWSSCRFESRTDGNDYITRRSVTCYDTATNQNVSSSQCVGAPMSSWKVFSTRARCETFVSTANG